MFMTRYLYVLYVYCTMFFCIVKYNVNIVWSGLICLRPDIWIAAYNIETTLMMLNIHNMSQSKFDII